MLSRHIYFGTMLSIFSSISNKSQLVLWGPSLGGHTYIIRMKNQSSRLSPRPLVSPTIASYIIRSSGQFESSPEWLINKRVHIYCTNPRIKSPKFNKWHWFAFYGNGIGKKTLTFLWLRSLFIILYTPLHLHTHRWLAWLKRVLCHVETSISMYKGKHVPLFRVAKSSRPSKNWLNRILTISNVLSAVHPVVLLQTC